MVVPFGFSIGDFIAVGDLARKIAQALSESRGSAAEYGSLCELLFSLDRSLQVASAIFLYSSSGTGSAIDTGPLNGIRYELGQCKKLMEEFLIRSKEYTESLWNGKGSRMKREWMKIKWCMYNDGDVQKLRDDLKGHLDAFNLYRSAAMRQAVGRIEQKAIEISETSNRIEQQTREISETSHRTEQMVVKVSDTSYRNEVTISQMFSLLKIVQGDMPKDMGYSWEADQKPIWLDDPLGRVVALPLVLCSTKENFHDVLKVMFKDRPGQKRIAENQYEITEDTEGAVIEDTDWESKVQPGTRISMGIIIVVPVPPLLKRDIFGDMELSNRPTNICPRCNILNNGATPIKGYLKCRKCDLVFRAQDTERIVEDLPEDPLEPLTRKRKAPVSEMPKQKTNKQRIEPREPKEEEIFQRIHYRREVSKYPHSQCRGDFCRRACTYRSPKEITLIEAAQRGDTKIVKQLLSDFIDINYNPGCHDSRTLLQAAAEGGHLEVVKLLLSHSADVNGAPAEWGGRTALQAAAGSGHLEVVKLLLSHSADVNAVSAESLGLTALQAAAECGHLEIVKLLLSHSADINAAPAKYSGRTALQAAAEGGHLEVMKLLLSHLADVNDAPAKYSGRTALQAAAEGGHLEVVKLLLSHSADVNAVPAEKFGRTALQAAAEDGHLEVVKLLLSHSADVNAVPAEKYGRTALQAAAQGGHLDVVKLLLSYSADINAALGYYGQTPLQAAAEGGYLEVVKLLLSHSADVNAAPAEDFGRTALQAAVEGGHLEVVKLLLSHSADVNAAPTEDFGRTALQAAAEGGHLEVVKLLLSHSADVNAAPAEYHGQTALQAAVKGGHPEVVKLLLSHGADVYAPASEYELTALEEAECYHNSVIKEQLLTVLMLHQANKHQ